MARTAGSSASPSRRIGEYFLLRQARDAAVVFPNEARTNILGVLALSEQQAEAARALWSGSHRAEALRLALQAFRTTIDGVTEIGSLLPKPSTPPLTEEPAPIPSSVPPSSEASEDPDAGSLAPPSADPSTQPWSGTLEALGLGRRELTQLEQVYAEATRAHLPALNGDITFRHGQLFRKLDKSHQQLRWRLGRAAMTPRQVRGLQVGRYLVILLVIAVAAGGLGYFSRTPPAEARASAHYGNEEQYAPDKAIDGDPATEWLLHDRRPGWLEITLPEPRRITKMMLLNGHNRHYNDRATKDYRIEFTVQGKVVRRINGSFPVLSPTPQWVEQPVDLDGVERIRFVVTSFHRVGAGMAEIAWE